MTVIGAGAPVPVPSVEGEATPDWDSRAVDAPGGHVLQGTAWAEHRRTQDWTPHFCSFADGRVALLLTHRQPPLPGFVAYAPRGPIAAGDPAERVALRAAGLAAWVRAAGGTILAVDPELDATPAYDQALARFGFRPTEEIQPSRHRLVLRFPPAGVSEREEQVFQGISKSSRQRIRSAEAAGLRVEEDPSGSRLTDFARLMDATAERRHFTFHAREGGFLDWWRRVLAAGQARFFVVGHERELVGGLLAYLQGGHYATAFSADRAELRERFPGAMHLLRWHVIREALRVGVPAIDLGGVDLRGARGRPSEADPGWGMYQHKASFGAEWVESAAAHEIVFRPLVYRTGLALRGLRRLVRDR
jgi:lipid II:glycine glycyltransferase (peptidoglycan interpeptide bridge formation enzyme)